jgi:hypothetical protein
VNLYILVEGDVGAKLIYKEWIQLANKSLRYVRDISEIEKNNYYPSAGGYPFYFESMEGAIADVNYWGNIDRLVFAVDSEELTF